MRRRVRGGFTSSVVRDASSDMPLRHRRIRREHIPAVSHARHRTRLISSSHALTRYLFVIKYTRSASGTTSFLYSTSAQYARIRNSAHPVPHMPACTWSPRKTPRRPSARARSPSPWSRSRVSASTRRARREKAATRRRRRARRSSRRAYGRDTFDRRDPCASLGASPCSRPSGSGNR